METVIFYAIIFVSIIRYTITAFFCFSKYFIEDQNICLKNYNIKKLFSFTLLYAIILSTIKSINNGPIIPFVSILILFLYFLIESKNFKKWDFPLTFSILVSLIIECTHILSYKIIAFILTFFNIFDTSEDYIYDENLLFWRTTVAIVYLMGLLLIYKSKLINLQIIRQISKNKLIPIFLISDFIVVIYLKYNLKCLDNKIRLILSNIFLFFPIALLALIIIVNKYTKKINKMQSKIKINTALEDAKNRKGEGASGLYFTVEKHKLEMEHFEQILKELGMNLGGIGRKQTIFAAVLLKQYDNFKDVELNKNIFTPISDIVNRTPKTVYRNIEYFIEKNFDEFKPGEIEKFYKGPISENKSAPTPAQFLFYIVQKCKKEELNNKNDNISDI